MFLFKEFCWLSLLLTITLKSDSQKEVEEEQRNISWTNNTNSTTNNDVLEIIGNISSIIDQSSKITKNKKDEYKNKFINYIKNRNYKQKEYKEYIKSKKNDTINDKFKLFIESDEYINALNNNLTIPIYNHTKFSDWSMDEKKAILMGDEEYEETKRRLLISCDSFAGWGHDIPTTRDYRSYSLGIKDQGSCGSCWAFACVAQYELNYQLFKNIKQRQSEQYILDCGGNSLGNCSVGGSPWYTNLWLGTYGSCPESAYYDYDGKDTWDCESCLTTLTSTSKVACITTSSSGGYSTTSYEWWKVMQNAASHVSVVVGMAISNDFFYLGSSNPYYYQCNSANIVGRHALATYGVSGLYITLKNSWGDDWGYNGFGWLYYTTRDTCQFSNYVNFNYWGTLSS